MRAQLDDKMQATRTAILDAMLPHVVFDGWSRRALEAGTREIHLEDIDACRGVQRGIAAQLWQPGPLSPLEGCLTRFHTYLADRLRES